MDVAKKYWQNSTTLSSKQSNYYYLIKMPKETRKSYPASLKLDAVSYAKKTSNHAAARLFAVDHTQISRWRTKEEDLKKARQTNRRAGSGALQLLKKVDIKSTRKRNRCYIL